MTQPQQLSTVQLSTVLVSASDVLHCIQGPRGETGPAGPPGPPGTIPKSIVSVGDRFSHYGLVNLSQITTLDPSTLAKFDIEFPAACKTWISRAPFTVEEFCAELVAFLARYGINISNAEGYVKVARTTGVLSLGARVNFFVGANVANELVAAGCLTKGRIYWRTVLDILCFRGLQDDVAWP